MAVTRSKRSRRSNPGPTPPAPPAGSKRRRKANANTPADSKQDSRYSKFLFKSEPESRLERGQEMKFSIDDLLAEPNGTAHWDGVRNYEARNCMQRMRVGDLGFFYHSNCRKQLPAVVGVVEVVREAYVDHTAFDKTDVHFDAKSDRENPKWFMVDVKLVRRFYKGVTLAEIKAHKELQNMQLVKRGRISVQSVSDKEWDVVMNMATGRET
eukprot:GFKZ01003333.1.p1 GENE.GFKZ01003333.1~~GFKZ01003333.1.p1  ORF type:complete len:211 (+),score=23.65 GFKZ01003333.1:722-1354(+)